jgi:hypothetical protein
MGKIRNNTKAIKVEKETTDTTPRSLNTKKSRSSKK